MYSEATASTSNVGSIFSCLIPLWEGVGESTDSLGTITYCIYLITHAVTYLHSNIWRGRRKPSCMVATGVCMFVVITRKAQVVEILLTAPMGNTIKRMKYFKCRKKYFWVTGKKKVSARIHSGKSVFVCDFVCKHARRWLLSAVAGPVSF